MYRQGRSHAKASSRHHTPRPVFPLPKPPGPFAVPGSASWHKVDELEDLDPIPLRNDAPPGRAPKSYESERWDCSPLFRPVRIPTDPPDCEGVSLDELLAGEYTAALVSTYLADIKFLLETAPRLKEVPFLLVQGIKEEK